MITLCYVKISHPSRNATYVGENAFALARHIEYQVNPNKVDHQVIHAVTKSTLIKMIDHVKIHVSFTDKKKKEE